jgi:hypothetical protein
LGDKGTDPSLDLDASDHSAVKMAEDEAAAIEFAGTAELPAQFA